MLIKMHITDIRIMNLMQISVQSALNVEVETLEIYIRRMQINGINVHIV